jgi:hypothetical protein
MTAGDLVTASGELELRELLHGGATPIVLTQFDPWVAPVVRADDFTTEGRDGAISGDELMGVRQIPLECYVQAGSDAASRAARAELTAAWAPSRVDLPLVWEDDGGRWCVFGRPRGASSRDQPAFPTSCRFAAMDPLIYSADEETRSLGLSPPTGGLEFPLEFPLVFGSGSTPPLITATNDGTADVPWRAVFTGPWTNPLVELVDTGDQVRVIGTVASGQTLTIDSSDGSIVLDTSARLGWIHSATRWWRIPPGSHSVRITGSAGSGGATFMWRHGWK